MLPVTHCYVTHSVVRSKHVTLTHCYVTHEDTLNAKISCNTFPNKAEREVRTNFEKLASKL